MTADFSTSYATSSVIQVSDGGKNRLTFALMAVLVTTVSVMLEITIEQVTAYNTIRFGIGMMRHLLLTSK